MADPTAPRPLTEETMETSIEKSDHTGLVTVAVDQEQPWTARCISVARTRTEPIGVASSNWPQFASE